MILKNSIRKKPRTTLVEEPKVLGVITEDRVRDFLQDVANYSGFDVRPPESTPESLEQLFKDAELHPELYRESSKLPHGILRYADVLDFLPDDNISRREKFRELQAHIRAAWDSPDQRFKEWQIFLARLSRAQTLAIRKHEAERPADAGNPGLRFFAVLEGIFPVPEITPFEAAMFYFQKNAHRARHCENPTCSAPYFFLKPSDKNRVWCGSSECANYGQRQYKRGWWQRNRAKQEMERQLPKRKNRRTA